MTVTDILRAARFVVDSNGKPMAAMLDIETWQQLVAWIKTIEETKPDSMAPVTSLEALWGDFWPEDESVDTFLATVQQWRQEDLTLHRDTP